MAEDSVPQDCDAKNSQNPGPGLTMTMTNKTKLSILTAFLQTKHADDFKIILETITDKSILCGVFTEACRLNQRAYVQMMIDAGVDVNIRDKKSGKTGLMLAVQNHHESIVQVLLDHGADVLLTNPSGRIAREYSMSASISHKLIAAENAQKSIKREQESGKSGKSVKGPSGVQQESEKSGKSAYAGMTDATKLGMLHQSFKARDSNTFKNVFDTVNDKSILGDIFIEASRLSCPTFMELMINGNIDVNIRDSVHGSTGLMFAAQRNDADVVRLLLNAGADVHLASRVHGMTARQFTHSPTIFKILDDAIVHQNAKRAATEESNSDKVFQRVVVQDLCLEDDEEKIAMLDILLKFNKYEIFGTVLRSVHDKSVLVKLFGSACATGKDHFVKLMIDFGIDVDSRTHGSGTALMLAAGNDHETTVALLLDHGANVLLKNSVNHNARYFAKPAGNIDKLLKNAEIARKATELQKEYNDAAEKMSIALKKLEADYKSACAKLLL